MSVSVIVPTYNRPSLLPHALESIADQRHVEVEAVVVNDGGVDISHIVASIGRRLPITLVSLPERHGLPAARNAGIEAAEGSLVAFLDDDDVYLPRHLATASAALHARGADVLYTSCPVSEHRVDPTRQAALVDELTYAFDFPFHDELLAVANFIPVTGVVLRNPRPGPARFDVNLPVEEDWDMWLRLHRQHGMRFAHLPTRTVVYNRPRGALSMTVQAEAGAGGRLRGFADNHQHLMRRWPVAPGSRAERFRGHLMTAYRLGFAELAAGRPLAHFYYERVLRALYEAMTGKVDEIQLAQGLAEAVREESV